MVSMPTKASPPDRPSSVDGRATENTPLLSHSEQDSSHIKKKQLGAFFIFILAVVALILGLGALIDRSWELNERYRLKKAEYVRQEEQWKTRTDLAETTFKQRLNQLNERYRQRESELQKKIKHFEEDLQKRFEEELQRKLEWEKSQRERARVHWSDIQGEGHCIANGRKKYTAQLANLPPTVDAMDACENTPVKINGITYNSPISCEDQGKGVLRGHWMVDNEPMCAAYWEFTKLKDCTSPKSGLRRVETKLGAVHAGEDREMLCLTTPLTINGETYGRPMACPDWGRHGFWGIWDVADENCT